MIDQVSGLICTPYRLDVPLDWDDPAGAKISVFARVVARPGGRDLPYLVFLQGGPGGEAPRPSGLPMNPSWLERALADYRVVLLDQRGTGLSTPVSDDLLTRDAGAQADYLKHFRADAIVRDCEAIREHFGAQKWSVLGQSFGGFTSINYLSRYASSLNEVYFTGGLPPVGRGVDEVYSRTYQLMAVLVDRHYRRFPGDRGRVAELVARCTDGDITLPGGELVSPQRFRSIGHGLGFTGGSEALHYLLERDPHTSGFRHDLDAQLPFGGRNPLYAVLHESSYADGVVTDWSADRTYPEQFEADTTLLTGEHLFRSVFDECAQLKPWKGAAELLALEPWPVLYEADALQAAAVPCAAAIYFDDPYVFRDFSLETAALLPQLRVWVTSEHLHNGLRGSNGRVLDRLIALVRDTEY